MANVMSGLRAAFLIPRNLWKGELLGMNVYLLLTDGITIILIGALEA